MHNPLFEALVRSGTVSAGKIVELLDKIVVLRVVVLKILVVHVFVSLEWLACGDWGDWGVIVALSFLSARW